MLERAIQELKLEDLNRLYTEGEEADKRVFAEMRTNLQLVAGEHYVREGSRFYNRVRDSKQLTQEQRLKLTKNHIQRVTKIYRNAIESYAPGVAIEPANSSELQDQKTAELNSSYWSYVKRCEDIDEKISTWIKNFVEVGEVCVKVFWNMNGGQHIGYEAQMAPHPETGEMMPVFDAMGQVVQSDKAVYGGKLQFETFEAFNLRRDRSVRTMKESPYLILSKLISKKAVRSFVTDDSKLKQLDSSTSTEYNVYDNNTGTYRTQKDQILVKELYFRPCPAAPKGWFFLYTDMFVIDQGELPNGIFPIVVAGFDEQTGNPRSHSVIRHCRPPQIEINRCASKIAEQQITNGDDKCWVPSNTKVSQGAFLPGVRVNTYSGMKPEITPGRSGDQYMTYLESQINELYLLANLKEVVEDQPESPDMYTNLLRSFRFRKKFAIYGQKFERFLMQVVETALSIAKYSISEEELVPAIGRGEYINIPEFKNSENIHYRIKLEPRSDDVESQFGKQITMNHLIQYIGPSLDKEDIGQLLRNSPFLNDEKAFEKFTQRYDNLVNDILALDRGQPRPPRKYDDHKYVIGGLTSRMSKSDFERLPPQVQQLYEQTVQQHEQLEAQQLQDIQRAQAGFIPSGGYLVACDFYQGDPAKPDKVKRVRIPSESLSWLIDKLGSQGSELSQLEMEPKGVLQDLGNMMPQGRMNAAA